MTAKCCKCAHRATMKITSVAWKGEAYYCKSHADIFKSYEFINVKVSSI